MRAGEAQRLSDGICDPGELVGVDRAAERQQLGAVDRDEQETILKAIGKLGRGEVAQQLVFGDVPDDPDVRGTGTQRVVSDHRLQRVAVPGLADDRRERVPFAREDFEDLCELLLEHELSLLDRGFAVVIVQRIADLGDETLAGAQAARQAVRHEALVGFVQQAAHMPPGGSFASLRRWADQDAELVGVVAVGLDLVVRAAAARGPERDEELCEQRHRVRLGVRLGPQHELARGPMRRPRRRERLASRSRELSAADALAQRGAERFDRLVTLKQLVLELDDASFKLGDPLDRGL